MYKFSTQFFLINLLLLVFTLPHASAQFQSGLSGQETQEEDHDHADYSESALRRFEIITLSSLPLSLIHI